LEECLQSYTPNDSPHLALRVLLSHGERGNGVPAVILAAPLKR
jgi:hypothetical protein